MPSAAPDVELRVPAEAVYASILRTAAAGLAARVDFSFDDIEDLRAAVDEACALLLGVVPHGSSLNCQFWLQKAGVSFEITGELDPHHNGPPPSIARTSAGFGWQMLEALTDEARYLSNDDSVTISLTRRRRAP